MPGMSIRLSIQADVFSVPVLLLIVVVCMYAVCGLLHESMVHAQKYCTCKSTVGVWVVAIGCIYNYIHPIHTGIYYLMLHVYTCYIASYN